MIKREFKKRVNPLLTNRIPKFNEITPEDFEPAVDEILEQVKEQLKEIFKATKFDWRLIAALEDAENKLSKLCSVLSLLNAVRSSGEIRTAYAAVLPKITNFITKLSQSEKIYRVLSKIREGKEFNKFNSVQKRVINERIKAMHLLGVDLPSSSKKRLIKINQRLTVLSQQFASNVLDATQKCTFIIDEKYGNTLPPAIFQQGKATAEQLKIEKDQLVFNLDFPNYKALMNYLEQRSLRKKLYRLYVTRASQLFSLPEYDNSSLMVEILKLREEEAKILGFENYAAYALADRMAKDVSSVREFLSDLLDKAYGKATREFLEIKKYAAEHGIKKVYPWDMAYLEEKMRKELFTFSSEELRIYFPLDQALLGMFQLVEQLFGITVREAICDHVWDQEVRLVELYDSNTEQLLGKIYLDLYLRDGKQGGAWMSEYAGRMVSEAGIQIPIAYLVGNFRPATEASPALLTHDDLLTLLHEFGHALQHILTKVDYLTLSGINGIPLDAVEFASQFMENWGWQEESIKLLSKHYQTGKPLPKELLNKLLNSRDFHAAISLLRQLEYAFLDLELHLEPVQNLTSARIDKLSWQISRKLSVTPVCRFKRISNSFSHIFAGGYAAGYYSYKWAEVLAADAFSCFKNEGVLNVKLGHLFRDKILAVGGSVEPLEAFEAFAGHKPSVDALLKQDGIYAK